MKTIFYKTQQHLLVFALAICSCLNTTAQSIEDTILLKERPVTITTNRMVVTGFLNSATDSSLKISSIKSSDQRNLMQNVRVEKYDFKGADISRIRIERKNHKLMGTLIGVGVGTLTGLLIAPRNKQIKPDNILLPLIKMVDFADQMITVVGCTLIGGGIGMLVSPGSPSNIPINGNYQNLNEFVNAHKK